MAFLLNCWYQVGWSDDLRPGESLARTVIGQPLILWRSNEGEISALSDRCPHRFAPLSAGKVEGKSVVCGYHGLAFGADGKCIANPHGAATSALKVRSYPTVEKHSALWVWMGDADLADASELPDLQFIDDTPASARITMSLPTAANYLLIADNILDLTHLDFIHPTTLGGLMNGAETKARSDDRSVHMEWIAKNVTVPTGLKAMVPDKKGDVTYILDWYPPGMMVLNVIATPVGVQPTPINERLTFHNVTPETEMSTHYFVCSTRRFAVHNEEVTEAIRAVLKKAFVEEDKPMIEKQQERMGARDFWALKPALLPIDTGAVRMRRIMTNLISEEAAGTADAAA